MNLEEQLEALIDFSPSHIQRHFACDCAERALKRAGVADQRLWKALDVSRRYAEGKATSDVLNAAWAAARDTAGDTEWDAAWDAAWTAAWTAARTAAWAAAWTAARTAAWAAAWNAARAAARDQERVWQIAHLQSLIATHNATRSSLLLVLQQRAESIKPVLVQYAKTLEARAFE